MKSDCHIDYIGVTYKGTIKVFVLFFLCNTLYVQKPE